MMRNMYLLTKKAIDKIKNPVDDFLIEEIKMIKEKYIQLCLARQFRGINTIEFIQSLVPILTDDYKLIEYE